MATNSIIPSAPARAPAPATAPASSRASRATGRTTKAAVAKSKEVRAQASSAARLGRSLMRLAERALRAVAAEEARADKKEKARERALIERKHAPPPIGDGFDFAALPEADAAMAGHALLYKRKSAADTDHGVPTALLASFGDPASSYVLTTETGERVKLIDHDDWHQRSRSDKAALKAGAVAQLRDYTTDVRQFDALCQVANGGAWEALQKVQRSWQTPVHLDGRRGQFLDGDVSHGFEIAKNADGSITVDFRYSIQNAQSFYPLDGGPRVPLSLTKTQGDAAFTFKATIAPDGKVKWSDLHGGVAPTPGREAVALQTRPQTKDRVDDALKVLNKATWD